MGEQTEEPRELEVLPVEPASEPEPPVTTRAVSVAALPTPSEVATRPTDDWAPSALALMTDDEFDTSLELAVKARDRLAAVQKAVMKEGVDYGLIPNTKKRTLLKSGAEILNKLARLYPTFDREKVLGDGVHGPPIEYIFRCFLHAGDAHGPVMYQGEGSCNTWEKKYRWRQGVRRCPTCGAAAIIKGKEQYGGGWVCWRKADEKGCGAEFHDDDIAITSQSTERTENSDQHDLDNTVLKIAKKRAFVDATLTAHAASGLFTQDIGDPDDDKTKPTNDDPGDYPPSGNDPPPPGEDPARGGRGNQPESDQTPPAPTQDERPLSQDQFKRAYAIAKRVGIEDITPQMPPYEVVCDVLAAAEIAPPGDVDRRNYPKLMKHTSEAVRRYRYEGFINTIERYRGPELGFLDPAAHKQELAQKEAARVKTAEEHEDPEADAAFERDDPPGGEPEQQELAK